MHNYLQSRTHFTAAEDIPAKIATLSLCWFNAGPASNYHWFNVSSLLDCYHSQHITNYRPGVGLMLGQRQHRINSRSVTKREPKCSGPQKTYYDQSVVIKCSNSPREQDISPCLFNRQVGVMIVYIWISATLPSKHDTLTQCWVDVHLALGQCIVFAECLGSRRLNQCRLNAGQHQVNVVCLSNKWCNQQLGAELIF